MPRRLQPLLPQPLLLHHRWLPRRLRHRPPNRRPPRQRLPRLPPHLLHGRRRPLPRRPRRLTRRLTRRAGPGPPTRRSAPTTSDEERPLPGSHARGVPTGTLEESAVALYEAAIAARDAEGGDDPAPLRAFYRAIGGATLLLPVPPGTEQEAQAAVDRAVDDEEEVEVGVLLGRGTDGAPVSVAFGSYAALAAWSPLGSTSLALPARIALTNLANAGMPVILDPAGPIPYRFEPDEIAALAAGRMPGADEPLFSTNGGSSIRVRLPGPEARDTERRLASELATGRDSARRTSSRPIPARAGGCSWAWSAEADRCRRCPRTSRASGSPSRCSVASGPFRIPSTAATDERAAPG